MMLTFCNEPSLDFVFIARLLSLKSGPVRAKNITQTHFLAYTNKHTSTSNILLINNFNDRIPTGCQESQAKNPAAPHSDQPSSVSSNQLCCGWQKIINFPAFCARCQWHTRTHEWEEMDSFFFPPQKCVIVQMADPALFERKTKSEMLLLMNY